MTEPEMPEEIFDGAATIFPIDWAVMCPACLKPHQVDRVSEDVSGYHTPDNEDKFILCECGCNIAVLGAEVRGILHDK